MNGEPAMLAIGDKGIVNGESAMLAIGDKGSER